MIEQVADADSVFSGDGEHVADAQAAILVELFFHLLGVDLVDRQQQWLAAAKEQAGKVVVGRGQGSAAIDDHDDGRRFIQRESRLAKDLRGNQRRVVGEEYLPVSTTRACWPDHSISP